MSSSQDKGYNICFLSAPPEVNSNGVVCTKPGGHEGPHEARGENNRLIATWTDEPVESLESKPGSDRINDFLSTPVRTTPTEIRLLNAVNSKRLGATVCFMDDTFLILGRLLRLGFIRVPKGDTKFNNVMLTPKGYAAIGTTPPAKTAKKERVRPVLTQRDREVLTLVRDTQGVEPTSSTFSKGDLWVMVYLSSRGLVSVEDGQVCLTDKGESALGVLHE